MAGEVRTEVRDGVGWITLSRPEKRNALTVAMWRALPKAVRALADRQDLVALVLQGAEGTFGAGADLTDIVAATESRATATEYCLDVVTALHAVATAPLPTVAVISGVAAGGGAELALACDLRIADPGAKITFPFARMGVVPDQLTLQRLAATVGPSRARRLVLTGETVDAAQALAIGLVDLVSEAGALEPTTRTFLDSLRLGSRSARTGMKRALAGAETTYDLAALIGPMVDSMVGGEVRAGALQFLEKA